METQSNGSHLPIDGESRSSDDFDDESPLLKGYSYDIQHESTKTTNSSSNLQHEDSKEILKSFYSKHSVFFYFGFCFFLIFVFSAIATLGFFIWTGSIDHHTPVIFHDIVHWPQKGITYTNGKYCPWVQYSSEKSDLSIKNLATTGANYVAIVVTQYQDNANSTNIYPTSLTASDDDLLHVIQKAHQLQLNVMLKPHVDLANDPSHWRGDIGTNFTEIEWKSWFDSYSNMIVHYAKLAKTANVSQFSIGCELVTTSPREQEWRALASQVRTVFPGNITYASNWGGEETNKTWWDAMDFIGVDAYYPIKIPNVSDPSVEQMKTVWNQIIQEGIHDGTDGAYMQGGLLNLTQHWNKPILFTEIGYCSGDCTMGDTVDLDVQSDWYKAVFLTFKSTSWFHGIFWWNWVTDPAFGGEYNVCCTPQGKPTEGILRYHYGGTTKSVIPSYPPVCPCIL